MFLVFFSETVGQLLNENQRYLSHLTSLMQDAAQSMEHSVMVKSGEQNEMIIIDVTFKYKDKCLHYFWSIIAIPSCWSCVLMVFLLSLLDFEQVFFLSSGSRLELDSVWSSEGPVSEAMKTFQRLQCLAYQKHSMCAYTLSSLTITYKKCF